jgi:serine/threonine protein kinase
VERGEGVAASGDRRRKLRFGAAIVNMIDVWKKKEALFSRAIALPATERSAFIEDATGDDGPLRDELLRMVRSHKAAGGDFLRTEGRTSLWPLANHIVDSATAAEERDEAIVLRSSMIGKRIGRYEITGVLGAGGMGVVYEAVQEQPRRRVAIKLLVSGLGMEGRFSRTALNRFTVEAEVLGRLNHPGIAQIIEAGSWDFGEGAQPFFAMELVEGRPLLDFVRERKLPLEDRLRLLVQICDAVHYAHQKGVVHRDLKPGNILVTEQDTKARGHVGTSDRAGEQLPASVSSCLRAFPKVLDFGIARAADIDVQITTIRGDVGAIIGTIAYMSPEQIRGDWDTVDARTDVYALGVVLYELLTGRMPYDVCGKAIPEAMRTIDETEPPRVSTLDRTLRGDLDTIVATAMAKEPQRRYASPMHLAEDLERYLRGEPILARKTSAAERAVKVARRHPLAASLLLLLAFVGVAFVGYGAITRQRLAAEVEVQQAMIVSLVDEVLARLHVLTGAIETRESMATSLLERTNRLLAMRPNDRDLLDAKGRLLLELGNVLSDRGDDPAAEKPIAQAVEVFAELARRYPDDVELVRRYADALVRQGYRAGHSDPQRRRERLAQADAIHQRLAQQHPQHIGVLDDLSWSYDRRFDNLTRTQYEAAAALEHLETRLELAHRLLALDPQRVLSHYNLMQAHAQFVRHFLRDRKDVHRLLHHVEKSLEYGERITTLDPGRVHFRVSYAFVALRAAEAHHRAGNGERAAALFALAEAQASRLLHEEPQRASLQRLYTHVMIEHAHAALTFADDANVRDLCREAKELAERHPRYLTGRYQRLLEEMAERLTGQDR